MKGVALLAFVAFIVTILPNRVEAAKCYACGIGEGSLLRLGIGNCDEFDGASADEKKNKFIMDDSKLGFPGYNCSKCLRWKKNKNGKVGVRICKRVGLDYCEGDFCNGPNGSAKSSKSTGKCYACGIDGYRSCEEFDRASAAEKKTKFMMDSKSPRSDDCKKCNTLKEEDGKVTLRACSDSSYDLCEGDLCNGAGSLKSWTATVVALLAIVVSILKGSLF